jgi:hypothetical protein
MNPLDLVRLTALMERGEGSPEIVIGLIDGPVTLDHADLAATHIREMLGKLGSACARSDSAACQHGTGRYPLGQAGFPRARDLPRLHPSPPSDLLGSNSRKWRYAERKAGRTRRGYYRLPR